MGNRAAEFHAARRRQYFIRGVAFAVASGICYGLYTGFLTLAETRGVWSEWFAGTGWGSGQPALNPFVVSFALAALAAGLNDIFSGGWSLVVCAKNRQLGDLRKTMMTKPGRIMMLCAALGGPLATTAYIAGLNAATAAGNPGVIVPIAALNCAIGAILGRILFRQELGAHKVAGIVICLVAGGLIGGASFAAIGPEALIACVFALVAAFGWGFEGCVAGFGTILIDYRIGIAIRQTTAGVLELLIMFPLLTLLGGDAASLPAITAAALASPALPIFALSGFFAMPAYSFWYKGNSMCGAALGMACNGMYAFWGPFFIWIIMGVLNLGGMAADYPPLAPVQWIGALIMVGGIFFIAVNPASLVRRQSGQDGQRSEERHFGQDGQGILAGGQKDGQAAFAGSRGSRGIQGIQDQGQVATKPSDASGPDATDSANKTPNETPNKTPATTERENESPRELIPLYYAIMKHFADGRRSCTAGVIAALEPLYNGYKLLTRKDVDEALATAKENGLLDESDYDLDEEGNLRIYYQVNDFGSQMIERYIGQYDNPT